MLANKLLLPRLVLYYLVYVVDFVLVFACPAYVGYPPGYYPGYNGVPPGQYAPPPGQYPAPPLQPGNVCSVLGLLGACLFYYRGGLDLAVPFSDLAVQYSVDY